MKKYFSIGKINFLNNIQYFSEFVFKAIFIALIMFIFINLWKVIYGTTPVIEGYTIAMMVWYLLISESILTSGKNIIRDINKEIQSGDVAYQLNKPYSYIGYQLAKSLSYRVIGFSVIFGLGSILVLLMVGGFNFNFLLIPLILLLVILAIILDFSIVIGISLLSFWFEDTNSFGWIYDKLIFTIGGLLIPLELFPKWLSSISSWLPFSFIAYHPAKLFVSFNWNNFIFVVSMQLVYIIGFLLIAVLIYKLGTRRLNINGG